MLTVRVLKRGKPPCSTKYLNKNWTKFNFWSRWPFQESAWWKDWPDCSSKV